MAPSVRPDSPEAGPVTPSASASDNASDFLLLSTTTPLAADAQHYAIPRPRGVPVLVVCALADWIVTAHYLRQSWPVPALGGLFAWGLLRPPVILYVSTSKRIRERGWVMLAQLATTVIVVLYHVNELVQRASTTLLAVRHISNVVQYTFLSLGFALMHYALFALFVGIRRRGNPFVGSGRPRGEWSETDWQGREQFVRGGVTGRSRSQSGRYSDSPLPQIETVLDDTERVDEEAEHEVEDDDETDGDLSSEDDEDELIDIPRPELRNRTSQMSLARSERLRDEDHDPAFHGGAAAARRPSLRRPSGSGDMRNSSKYGSIHSLAGI